MKNLNRFLICFFILLPMRFAGDRVQINSDKFYIEALSTKEVVLIKPVQLVIKKKPPKKRSTTFIVTAATYTQGTITASGFKINLKDPGSDRIIAVSRDLKTALFGKKVLIEGIGKYSGIYTVRDLMHPRWTNKIDILRSIGDDIRMYYHVKVSILK